MIEDRIGLDSSAEGPALLERLTLIEERSLAERAAAYTTIHDELQSQLENSDVLR